MAKICSNCGESLKDDIKFCPNCGKEITSEEVIISNESNNAQLKKIEYDIAEIRKTISNISSKIRTGNNIETSDTGTFYEWTVMKYGGFLAILFYLAAAICIIAGVAMWLQFRDFMGNRALTYLIGGAVVGVIYILIGLVVKSFIATFANISINLHEINQKL